MQHSLQKLVTVILLMTVISCTKEPLKSSSIQSSSAADKSLSASDINDGKAPAGRAVRIGTQVWLTKNLDVTLYRNGDRIPQVRGQYKWDTITTGAWCWYKNDSATYAATYGRLYNWYAVNDPRGLAPTGWHIPSDAEWDTLAMRLGNNAGGKMKSTGTIGAGTGMWYAPNFGATNSSGFTGLPGGWRYNNGTFSYNGYFGFWWSSTESGTYIAWHRNLAYDYGDVSRVSGYKQNGFSIRCLRD